MLLSRDNVRAITDKILARSKAEACSVAVAGGDMTNLRFARNNATTNGADSSLSISITSHFGKRSCAVTASSFDDAAVEAAQRRSEQMAPLAPENPESLPPLGQQTYEKSGAAYDAASASVSAEDLAGKIKGVLGDAKAQSIVTAGYAVAGRFFSAMATSAGLFVYDQGTSTELTITARNAAQTWSGWASGCGARFTEVDFAQAGTRAITKANYTAEPIDIEPGKYTVILEPAAVSDLIGFMLWDLNARPADEGRNYFAKKGGGNKIGEKLFDERVTIVSDPADELVPAGLYDEEGLALRRTPWIENGVLKNLSYSRFWAQKQGVQPIAAPRNFHMKGGATSIEDMIAATKRGILVTRLWYIRVVDPQTMLLTGMTRDGNFLIENGRIVGPVHNMRFNESPAAVLSKVEAVGPVWRTLASEIDSHNAAPALLVRDFTFSSRSSGI